MGNGRSGRRSQWGHAGVSGDRRQPLRDVEPKNQKHRCPVSVATRDRHTAPNRHRYAASKFKAGPRRVGSMGAILALAAVMGFAGCGSGSTGPSDPPRTSTPRLETGGPGLSAEEAAARDMGRRACDGLEPLQAARQFSDAAKRVGATLRFVAAVANPVPAVRKSPGYPRLVASLYGTTVPTRQAAAAAAGCAEELVAPPQGR